MAENGSHTPTSAPPTLQLRRSNTGGRSSSALPRLTRRSTQERIHDILDTARERAETMSSGQYSPRMQPLLGTQSAPPRGALRDLDDSADDGPGIVMKGPNSGDSAAMNYQSTSSSGPRSRRSGTSRGKAREENENNTTDGAAEAGPGREKTPWWKNVFARFQSIELENKGSVARDHLALERTFLAWLRTSLAFASIGIAVTQLFRLNTSLLGDGENESSSQNKLRRLGKPLGSLFIAISILILFLGYHRYFQGQEWIIKGKFPASRGTVILVSLVAFSLMVVSLIVVIVVQPSPSGS